MFTRALAEFVAETRPEDVPEAALDAALAGATDTLGCALAGTLEPVAGIAARYAEENSGRGKTSVWGTGTRASAPDAAFANAIAAHALDFDDSHPHARGHASASLVPAALAAGEAAGASGRAVLEAYAIGIEVAGKIGRAFGHGHLQGGWHPTATIGTLACSAVAARIAGHDVETAERTFGIAGSGIAGLVRNFGTMTKPFHAGQAARAGTVAAWMAGAGQTADRELLDGKGGVLDAYAADGEDVATVAADLGRTWEILKPGNYVKRWPCCYSNHRAIAGLTALIADNAIEAGEVSEVEVSFLPGGDKALISREPKTGLEGKFSIEYCAAALLIDGALGLSTFTDEQVMRPEIQAFIPRVKRRYIPSDTFQSGMWGHNDIIVTTPRGKFEIRVDKVPGSPDTPLTDADRAEKFTDCAQIALGREAAVRLLAILGRARDLADIGELSRGMAPEVKARAVG